jgi:hypothetical protein
MEMEAVLSSGLVRVLVIRPKVCVFRLDRRQWVFKGIKFRSTLSFGGEVNSSALCRNILRHEKDPCGV